MKYRIYKYNDDGKMTVAGIMLPDGFYRVVSLSRKNWPNIAALEKHGYVLEELPESDKTKVGLYEEGTDKAVSDESAFASTAPLVPGQVTRPPLKYLTAEELKDYVCPTLTLGMSKDELRAMRRGNRVGRRGGDQVKAEVAQSRASGLKDVAGMLGIKGDNLGELESSLREKLGS